MKKLFGLAVAMMLGLNMVGCDENIESTATNEEPEMKQEEMVEEPEVEEIEEVEVEEEPIEEPENTVITMEDETFKHYMTDSLDGTEYSNYFNHTLGYYQEIEFDGYVVAMYQSEKYTTRSELVLAAGDYDGNNVNNYLGVTIVTRDIETYKVAGLMPGTNVKVKALIEDYDAMQRGNLKIKIQEIEAR